MGGKGRHRSRVPAQQEARHGPHHFISSLQKHPQGVTVNVWLVTFWRMYLLAMNYFSCLSFSLTSQLLCLQKEPRSRATQKTTGVFYGEPCFSHVQVWNEEAQLREVGAAAPGGTGPLPEVTEGEGRGEAPPKQLVPEGRAIC